MESAAIVIAFFALVIIPFGLVRGFRSRSRRENFFYLFTIALSLTALLLTSLRG